MWRSDKQWPKKGCSSQKEHQCGAGAICLTRQKQKKGKHCCYAVGKNTKFSYKKAQLCWSPACLEFSSRSMAAFTSPYVAMRAWMLACLSTNPMEVKVSSWVRNRSSGGVLRPCPAILVTICCMSWLKAWWLLPSVDDGVDEVVFADEDEVVVVVVELVVVVSAVEAVEAAPGGKFMPTPRPGKPMVP